MECLYVFKKNISAWLCGGWTIYAWNRPLSHFFEDIFQPSGTLTEIEASDFIIKKTDNNNSNMIDNETKKIKIHEESE